MTEEKIKKEKENIVEYWQEKKAEQKTKAATEMA